MTVSCADVYWREDGALISRQFDDVYSSKHDPVGESRYVFLEGGDFDEFLRGGTGVIHVAELGFGTGLNFLLTRERARQLGGDRSLIFSSCDRFPLSESDFRRANSGREDFDVEEMMNAYSLSKDAWRCRLDDGGCVLRVWFTDVLDMLNGLDDEVDLWYLDGFSPARNPDMWSQEVYTLMAARSKVGARVATYSAAGAVKRGLESVGFRMERRDGFGGKRHMLTGVFRPSDDRNPVR